MQVTDFCSRDVVTVEPHASLREAPLLMRNRRVGTLVVVGRTSSVARPVGIITDRDIVVAVIAVPGARPEGIRVCDVMQAAYEAPLAPEIVIHGAVGTPADGAAEIAAFLAARGWI